MGKTARTRSFFGALTGCGLAVAAGMSPVSAETVFRDVTREWGLSFEHHHGGSGERYMVETMSGGVVIFDYDLDGDDDLLFVDGGALPGYEGEPARTRLFRNDTTAGRRAFVDRTDESKIRVPGYGVGAAAGDVDGDGDLDLYITGFGSNSLWRNLGDGSFEEMTAWSGADDELWTSSAALSDVDRDGDLDLYLANYVDFTLAKHQNCSDNGIPIYCHPGTYPGVPDRFLRNLGDGRFEDATVAAGFDVAEDMAGLGVIFGDLTGDGWPDLYVANDTEPNFLFFNRGDGTFSEEAFLAGTAVSERGMVEAGMGVDLGDVDADGDLDVVVTNFEMETNALYKNIGSRLFVDSRYPMNVAESSLLFLAFGVVFADFDLDGDLDLAIANGHVRDNASQFHATGRYGQRNQLLENDGKGVFREIEGALGKTAHVSRGLAAGDLDLDGDLDLAVLNSNGPAEVLENRAQPGQWIKVDLVGAESNRFGIDARVELDTGGSRWIREVRTASSYQSQNSITLHFGTDGGERIGSTRVAWPSGKEQRFQDLMATNRYRLYE